MCNIAGLANQGRILAILGASGSGKTTLLNFLTGHISKEFKVIFYYYLLLCFTFNDLAKLMQNLTILIKHLTFCFSAQEVVSSMGNKSRQQHWETYQLMSNRRRCLIKIWPSERLYSFKYEYKIMTIVNWAAYFTIF